MTSPYDKTDAQKLLIDVSERNPAAVFIAEVQNGEVKLNWSPMSYHDLAYLKTVIDIVIESRIKTVLTVKD